MGEPHRDVGRRAAAVHSMSPVLVNHPRRAMSLIGTHPISVPYGPQRALVRTRFAMPVQRPRSARRAHITRTPRPPKSTGIIKPHIRANYGRT